MGSFFETRRARLCPPSCKVSLMTDTTFSCCRLPKPPTRTFGMLRIFPEKMERFRRDQLEAYMQELLSIPEAVTNRAVLSFVGLVSTSR